MTKLRKVIVSPFSIVTLALVTALTALTAGAATRQLRYDVAQREVGEPIMAVISIESQIATFYDANGWIYRTPVSTGTRGRETPAGIFSVVERNREHRSNMYDDAKMPHMQRITWNGIALHGGPLPGYAASHGCVRMPYGFAAKLFNKTRIGMRVIISPHDTAPIDVSHPVLFAPDPEIIAAAPAWADRLKLEAVETAKGYKEAKKTARSMARKVVLQKRFLRKLEGRKKRAGARLIRANKALSAAEKANVRAYEWLQKRAAEETDVGTQLGVAKAALEIKVVDADAAATAASDAAQASDEAKKSKKSAENEVELRKATLLKQEGLKKKADAELKSADKALSAADKAKVQAEEQQEKATVEATELAQQIKIAKSKLKAKVLAAAAATTAANAATRKSDEAKKVASGAERVVALRKETLAKLENLKKTAGAELKQVNKPLTAEDTDKAGAQELPQKPTIEVTELVKQINSVESELKVRTTVAAVVAKIAHDATKTSDEAKEVERSAASEVTSHKEALGKLESLKKSADEELKRAHEALSVADKAKVQAEERQRKATVEATDLAKQLDIAESDLNSKVVAAEAATAEANKATQASDEAKKVEKSKAREVVLQKAALRKLENLKKKADAELKRADKALSVSDKKKVEAEEKQRKATAEDTELATQLDSAKSELKEKVAAAATAKDAVKAAKIRKAETANAAREAKLSLEPVSVYISRATQKLYVRRNTHKPARDGGGEEFDTSIEVPVTIYDPDKPIGTHIFTAMEHNDTGLRWTVVSIDNGDDARGALNRITIPQDVFERIALTALPRSSIIISDEPLSRETNYRTEFVTVLNNQPQGGFITRKITQAEIQVPDEEESDEEDDEESNVVRRTPRFLNF